MTNESHRLPLAGAYRHGIGTARLWYTTLMNGAACQKPTVINRPTLLKILAVSARERTSCKG